MSSIFTWKIRVYYEDTDAGGVVFYANYLKFFERARTEWLRNSGINQHKLRDSLNVMFVVRKTAIEFHQPAKLDDELILTVEVDRLGGASLDFIQEARCGAEENERLLVNSRIKIVCIDAKTFRPTPIPDFVLNKVHIGPEKIF